MPTSLTSKKQLMEDLTEKKVARVIQALTGVRNYRCRYRDISFGHEIDAQGVVEIRGDSAGRVRLNSDSHSPRVETVIAPDYLVRVDHGSKSGYRIDFTRHPFSDFHRYGWLRVDHPFTLLEHGSIAFRAEISEAPGVLVFQGSLGRGLLPRFALSNEVPSVQVTLDAKYGLMRELLIVSGNTPQRFVFTDYVVNHRLRKDIFRLEPPWEVGDMTELYWNQIQAAQGSQDPPAPFFSWN